MSQQLVIVTGASRGLGAALVRGAPAGARCVGVARSEPPAGAPCEFVRADLATAEGWERMASLFAAEIPKHAGAEVVCFHNAGTLTPIGFAGEVDPEAYARNVLLNSAAPQIVGDAFLRAAASCDARATLVQISSGAASSPYEGWSAYCAGKAAVDHWTRTVGLEQARRGGRRRVLAVAPGIVATAMQEEIRATGARAFPDVERFRAYHEEGELRDPDAVASDLWSLLGRELENGAVLDLRDATGGA